MSFTKEIEKQTLPIPCPECGRKVKKRIEWIKRNKQLICICGLLSHLTRNNFSPLSKELKKSSRSLTKPLRILR